MMMMMMMMMMITMMMMLTWVSKSEDWRAPKASITLPVSVCARLVENVLSAGVLSGLVEKPALALQGAGGLHTV
jgi:hypothetical protein